jgi:hypothetical protein
MIEESEPARMTAAEASTLISARKLSCEELVLLPESDRGTRF